VEGRVPLVRGGALHGALGGGAKLHCNADCGEAAEDVVVAVSAPPPVGWVLCV
jgi:hypothetical protein